MLGRGPFGREVNLFSDLGRLVLSEGVVVLRVSFAEGAILTPLKLVNRSQSHLRATSIAKCAT